jgi:NTE family protein
MQEQNALPLPVTQTTSSPTLPSPPRPGIGLCLSGGGYRAMLFHVGAFWRLNEFGYLPKLDRISSVSGGSITAGLLGLHWSSLAFDQNGVAQNFEQQFITPIREFAGTTTDVWAILAGMLGPGTIGDRVADAYRKHLFGASTLQSLPDHPNFVINTTNVQSGVLCRFSKPYMWDYRVGQIKNPTIELAIAVAASSAFPPVLSPVQLSVKPSLFTAGTGTDLEFEPYTSHMILTDGGVYDNLGLETVWKEYDTILVSDAGGKLDAQTKPKTNWIFHALRVLNLIDSQVRSLRKRQVIDSYTNKTRKGTYWGIRTNIANYGLANALPCPEKQTLQLADIATRLKRLSSLDQERLINWGYAVCDAAMRKHVDPTLPTPVGFPYPAAGVGN